jgi:hypothetical protein
MTRWHWKRDPRLPLRRVDSEALSSCSTAAANRTVIVVHDSGRLYPEAIIFTTTAPE